MQCSYLRSSTDCVAVHAVPSSLQRLLLSAPAGKRPAALSRVLAKNRPSRIGFKALLASCPCNLSAFACKRLYGAIRAVLTSVMGLGCSDLSCRGLFLSCGRLLRQRARAVWAACPADCMAALAFRAVLGHCSENHLGRHASPCCSPCAPGSSQEVNLATELRTLTEQGKRLAGKRLLSALYLFPCILHWQKRRAAFGHGRLRLQTFEAPWGPVASAERLCLSWEGYLLKLEPSCFSSRIQGGSFFILCAAST